jgi:hypothetical protein
MTTLASDVTMQFPDVVATAVQCDETMLHVSLSDGRIMSVPLVWFPRLLAATPEQRAQWELLGPGTGISWPELDEDLSVVALLRPKASPAPGGKVVDQR